MDGGARRVRWRGGGGRDLPLLLGECFVFIVLRISFFSVSLWRSIKVRRYAWIVGLYSPLLRGREASCCIVDWHGVYGWMVELCSTGYMDGWSLDTWCCGN